VPVCDQELPVIFHSTTADHQDVTCQIAVTCRVSDPKQTALRFDFGVSPARGSTVDAGSAGDAGRAVDAGSTNSANKTDGSGAGWDTRAADGTLATGTGTGTGTGSEANSAR
jgi:hypothetical protein